MGERKKKKKRKRRKQHLGILPTHPLLLPTSKSKRGWERKTSTAMSNRPAPSRRERVTQYKEAGSSTGPVWSRWVGG